MKKIFQLAMLLFIFVVQAAVAQDDAIVDKIVAEGTCFQRWDTLAIFLDDMV
jgi:hypothetical protein